MENIKLGDICTKVCSGGTPTSSNPAYYNGDIPWLNTNEVNFCNIYSTNKTISEEGLKESAAKYVPQNTIIVAMYGVTAGKCAIAKIPLTTNQACCNLVIDKKKADYRYVYYFLKQQSECLNRLAIGGAQQNLNAITIRKYKIALPPLPLQQKIASILSAYDMLIENNTRRIRLLEQMAENLYKEWFVRFRFPGHEKVEMVNGLPKGWEIKRVSNVCETIGGGTPTTTNSAYWGGDVKWVTPSDLTSKNSLALLKIKGRITEEGLKKSSAKLLPPYTILMTSRASIGFFGICPNRVCTNQGFISIIPNKEIFRMYLLYSFKSRKEEIISNANGSTFLEISKGRFRKMKVMLPSEDILDTFEKRTFLMFKEVLHLEYQNTLLTRQRDLLLPRLMSGKLEVKP